MKYLALIGVAFVLCSVSTPALALGPAPRIGVPGPAGGGSATSAIPPGHAFTLNDISGIIDTVVRFFVRVAGIIMVGAIVVSGVRWVTAGSDETKVESAKAMLKNSLYGAAIILGVGAILWTINGLISGEFFFGGYGYW